MENYVSFELAKKLKEKGFREECIRHYLRDNLLWNCMKVEPYDGEVNVSWAMHSFNEFSHDKTDAPTISQVLKWLREEKKIHVTTVVTPDSAWRYVIMLCDERGLKEPTITEKNHFDYSSAIIAGIEYVLDNLI